MYIYEGNGPVASVPSQMRRCNTKTLSDCNQTQRLLHDAALYNGQNVRWEDRGFIVNVGGKNNFRLHGKSATFAGKPDLTKTSAFAQASQLRWIPRVLTVDDTGSSPFKVDGPCRGL